MRAPLLSALVVVAITLASSRARAGDDATAQSLFEEGKRLLARDQVEEACARFEESERLDPSIGTLFQYASCEERLGRTATAWRAYLDVASQARAAGASARAEAARVRADALKPKLSRLTVEPGPDAPMGGFAVTRDGAPIDRALWGVSVPVDPGVHAIEATAPEHGRWTARVDVAPGTATVVTVPLLASVPTPPPVAPAPPDASRIETTAAEVQLAHRGDTQRAVGLVLGAAGVAAGGVGAYFGAVALHKRSESNTFCGQTGCDASGQALREDYVSDGSTAAVALAVGGGLIVAGIVTYVTAPSEVPTPSASPAEQTRVDTTARLAVGPTGVTLSGAF